MKFIVDANVLSEPTKPQPSSNVIAWLRANEPNVVVNPIVLGEIEYGILLVPEGRRRRKLREWFRSGVQNLRVLDFDARAGSAWAQLLARLRRAGQAMPIKDSLVAATALAFDLTVATRNIADFQNAGVRLVNPFGS